MSRVECAHLPKDYLAWGVRTRDNAESQIRSVVFRREDGVRKTVGCIFPISSFDPDSDYCARRLEDPHQKAFSSQATTLIVENGIANGFVRASFLEIAEESKLSDLFELNTSVVIIGKPLMKDVGADEEQIRLALQGYGYFVLPSQDSLGFDQYVSVGAGHRNIEAVSCKAAQFTAELTNIVAIAANQSSPTAAFLAYYQVFELFSQERFRSEITRLTQDEALRSDAWALREKLTEAAGERRRLEALLGCCGKAEANTVNAIRAAGRKILRSVGTTDDVLEKMSAAEIFYKVRNLIVHDQKRLSTTVHSDIVEFVYSTHDLVFALMRSFDPEYGYQALTVANGSSGSTYDVSARSVAGDIRISLPRAREALSSSISQIVRNVIRRLLRALQG
ncbi:MAG: hypothetical protein EOP09_01510 [Proteobacteria bacterium]|nr:MAG: hypothetical protein EOP09_01510 [Pseudomonadota bacterium]